MDNPIVNAIDIVRTFDNGSMIKKNEATYHNYYKSFQLYKLGKSISAIGSETGVNKSVVWNWVVEGRMPRSLAAVKKLEELGLMPFDYQNKKFDAINYIAAWAYWSGSISKGKLENEKRVGISANLEQIKDITSIIKSAGFGYELCKQRDEIYVSEGGSILGRLLSCMGLPSGKKSKLDEIALPNYITRGDCPSYVTDDFLKVLFTARHSVMKKPNKHYRIHITSCKTEYAAEKLLSSVTELLDRTGKEIRYSKTVDKNGKVFMPCIYMNSQNYKKMFL